MMKKNKPATREGYKEIISENPPVRFTVPERLSVREVLQYSSLVSFSNTGDKNWLDKRWEGAKLLIDEWECKILKDPQKLDLDSRDIDPKVPTVISFVSSAIWVHVLKQDELEKK